MRNEREAGRAVEQYADTVRRICFMYLKNQSDVEDVFQEVFLKHLLHEKAFASDEHEKAWLIRVSINACKDVAKSFFRRRVHYLEDVKIEPSYLQKELQDEDVEILDAVRKLPDNYKSVIYLFYYEGYTAVEIAKLLHKNENTIYTWLSRARSQLKNVLGGESFEK